MDFNNEFINITHENINKEHLCCIIRSKKTHCGIENKRNWLNDRLDEGHVFRKLNVNGCAFIEYAPLEYSWTPVIGDNYLYIYCLWCTGEYKGKGYGKALINYCINDAKQKGKSGICMLGAIKQKAWLSDQKFAQKFGFRVVDITDNGYELLALSFDGSEPHFSDCCKTGIIENNNLTIYYDSQCPYIIKNVNDIKAYCKENNVPADFIYIDSLEKAKSMPSVFNNYAIFYNKHFVTVNLMDKQLVMRLILNDRK